MRMSGEGGRPVRSSETRRIRARGSASGAGESFLDSRPARMKASMGLRTQSLFLTGGRAGREGVMKLQWGCQGAPSVIQVLRRAISLGLSCRWASGGGMTSSGSLLMRR